MKAKRRAIAVILFAAAKGLEVSTDKLKEALAKDLRKGIHAREYALILQRYNHLRKVTEELRVIARTMWDTSKKK